MGEEFQKVQRGLRRLSLASDRSGEVLQALSAQVDELRQALVERNRPERSTVALEELEVLQVVDELDRASDVMGLPMAARARLDRARTLLLERAGWQRVAPVGASVEDVAIRVAESLGEREGAARGDARVHRVLEQGYRREDGTLVRAAVVIAATTLDRESTQLESQPFSS